MKKLEFQDIIPLQEYEKIRESFRQSVIEQKKRRHVQVGPYVSLAFENRETVLFQVQEMIRAERLQDPAKIQEEIDVYNDLIPGARELSATLFIEITEEGKIQEILNRLIGIDKENMVYFQIGKKKRIPAIFEAGRSKEEDQRGSLCSFQVGFHPNRNLPERKRKFPGDRPSQLQRTDGDLGSA